jgi:predicted O-methyltransferase YrrM
MKTKNDIEPIMQLARDCVPVNRMITTAIPTMDGWCTVEKAFTLAGLVLKIQPKICVEIGTYAGRSFLPMLWALMQTKSGKAIGIDPYDAKISSEQEFPGNSEWWATLDHAMIEKKFHAFLKAYASPEVFEVVKKTSDAYQPPTEIDLLHIDGGHTDVAIHDAKRYGANVRPGGFIVLDDIQWVGGSVLRAIDELETMGFTEVYRNVEQNWNIMQRAK